VATTVKARLATVDRIPVNFLAYIIAAAVIVYLVAIIAVVCGRQFLWLSLFVAVVV